MTWKRSGTKYGSRKAVYDGITFDSKRECLRYQELLLLERAGAIHDLQRQVKFILIPTQRMPDRIGKRGGHIEGKVLEKEASYVADFVYKDKDGNIIVEDSKGFKTKDYVLKRKLMLFIHGIRIHEV